MIEGVSMDHAGRNMLEAYPTTLEFTDIINQNPLMNDVAHNPTSYLPPISSLFTPGAASPSQMVPPEVDDPLSDCGMSVDSEDGPKHFTDLTNANISDEIPAIRIKSDPFDGYETTSDTMDSWLYKHPEEWGSKEILDWIYSWLPKLSVSGSDADCCGENFSNLDGKSLIKMSEEEFMKLEPTYGKMYYAMLHKLLQESMFVVDPIDCEPNAEDVRNFLNEETQKYLNNPISNYTYDIDTKAFDNFKTDPTDDGYESTSSGEYTQVPTTVMTVAEGQDPLDTTSLYNLPGNRLAVYGGGAASYQKGSASLLARQRARGDSGSSTEGCMPPPQQKKRGRRLGQVSNKGNHLWEFIRDLLKSPNTNPSLIRWEDEDNGVFRIVNSKKVSELWGKKKNNPGMNYEKLSRAMRHYYKSKILVAVLGRRLVYKFGVNSTGWQKPSTNASTSR